MTETVAQIRNRIRPTRRLRVVQPVQQGSGPQGEFPGVNSASFTLETEGRVVISSPVEMAAKPKASDFFLDMRGRLVEAETANQNGAFWTSADLEFGLPSVAYGPLNWGHDAKDIVGTLLDPSLVSSEQAAGEGLGPYIQTGARFWAYLSPRRAAMLSDYVEQAKAWLSMECISEQIQCVGPNGCGALMPYLDAQTRSGEACAHVKERASHRRFVNPIFQGAAVIVPPQSPGWKNANITGFVNDAEARVEAAGLAVEGLEESEAVAMVTTILQWANRRA